MKQDDSINDYLAHLLAQANRRLGRALNAQGVPLDQWRILRVLHETGGMTMRALADAVTLNRPTMTKIVDKLVMEGLAYRVPDPQDRRKVRIFLSDQGKALYREQHARVTSHQAGVENSYGQDETQQLKHLLEDLLKRIN
ncbi:MarR family winged helix-turn-helix transcriptional regulator [Ruegeria sp. HKCCD8929]|uniref:MarR family winged helix-turn-helix transcriptional regulator n=1 Tax=Ruegeria sp. HKCCD8929 TaxID=2683006 RepID=UPI00148A0BDB|nr:MarR family transcriptional regulator [Ruegeria sp. HKCCD8929]